MKRIVSFLWMAMALLLSQFAGAQTAATGTILIGDTTNMALGGGVPYQFFSDSYTQQLVLGSELNGATMITGLDLYCGNPSTINRQCTIYLANTFVPYLSSMVPFGAMFQQVAVVSFACPQGWVHYEFDTPFYYNGFGNLVIAFDSPYAIGGGDFYCEQTQNISRYAGVTLSNLTSTFPTAIATYRNIMRLHTQTVPSPAATCPAPELTVEYLGPTEVTVASGVWGATSGGWMVECITDGDSAWRTGDLMGGDTSYTLTGLTSNTRYVFRFTNFCSDTTTSIYRHILTNCPPESVPFSEDFDASWNIPSCWYGTPGSTGNTPSIMSNYSHSSAHSVQLNGGSLVLPFLDTPLDSLELSFWTKNGTVNPSLDLYVGVVVDPLDFSTFTPVDTVVATGWNPVVLRFDHYTGPAGRIAIKTAIDYIQYMYVDDIEVNYLSPCQTITTVSVDQVTDTSAVVHWIDTTATNYEVAYEPSGFPIDSSYIVSGISSDSLQLGGLLPYTTYDVYIRSLCGSTYTNWSPVRSFLTLCSLLDTLPYTEDFDSYIGNPKPTDLPCWRGNVTPNTCVCGLPYGGDGLSGQGSLRWWWSSHDATSQYAILPALNTTILPINTLQLSFWAKNMEDVYNLYDGVARVVVGVMSDPDNLGTFQPVDTVNIHGYDWHRYDIPLNGTGQYVAIRSIQGGNAERQWVAFIDNISIDLTPSCPNVTGMRLTGLTATSVTVQWDNGTPGTTWQVAIDTTPSSNLSPLTSNLASPEYTFDGLVAETPYYVWVRAICPIGKGDTSEWEGPLMVMPGAWNMRPYHSDTLTACGIIIYDDGGRDGDFSTQISQLVIMPDILHHLIRVSGQSILMCTAASLTIYDGIGTSGLVLWSQSVNDSYNIDFGPIVSESGPITIKFEAYGGNNQGFVLNISCIPDTCVIHHLRLDSTVVATDSTLALTWECNGSSLYEVEYGPVGFAPGTGTQVTTAYNSLLITGLTSLERREVRVRSVCGEDAVGDWVRGIFTTEPCADAVFRDNFDDTMIEASLPAGPVGFNGTPYSYSQTIIDPAFLAGLEGGITALAFRPADYIEGDNMNNVTVYLANVPESDLNDGPIVPDATHQFVKVIDSANFCHMMTSDWQTFPFDHHFQWDGHSSLLVAALKEDDGSGMRTEYSAHYRHSDFDSIFRSYQIASWIPIDINDAQSYISSAYSDGYGTFLFGDIRLYSNTCTPDSPVGIGEIQNPEFNIQIYPNPTTSRVTVQCPMPITTSCLTDMMGRRKEVRLVPQGGSSNQSLTQSSNHTYTLDLTAYPQGAYFLILTTADGQQRTLRLIKQSNTPHHR